MQRNGTKTNRKLIFTLQFSGDQVIIAKSKDNFAKMAIKIKEEYERWGHYMNIRKMKYLCIGGK